MIICIQGRSILQLHEITCNLLVAYPGRTARELTTPLETHEPERVGCAHV